MNAERKEAQRLAVEKEMLRLMNDGEWWYVLEMADKGDYGWWLNHAGVAGIIYVNLLILERRGMVQSEWVDQASRRRHYRIIPDSLPARGAEQN